MTTLSAVLKYCGSDGGCQMTGTEFEHPISKDSYRSLVGGIAEKFQNPYGNSEGGSEIIFLIRVRYPPFSSKILGKIGILYPPPIGIL